MKRILGFAVVVALGGCYSPNVPNGQLKCSTNGNKCPEGFHCATDGTCWKNGQDPTPVVTDMSQVPLPDLSSPVNVDMGPTIVVPAHKGSSVMSGGVTATSEHYKIITSTGQTPGGNVNASSTNFKKAGGLVGATQSQKK